MKYEYYIFLIVGGPNKNEMTPIATFIEFDYGGAKLYFQAYLQTSDKELRGARAHWYYKLAKIAKLVKGKQPITEYAYIEDSNSVQIRIEEEQKTPTQLQLEAMRRYKQSEHLLNQLYRKNKYPSQTEVVEALFQGRKLND